MAYVPDKHFDLMVAAALLDILITENPEDSNFENAVDFQTTESYVETLVDADFERGEYSSENAAVVKEQVLNVSRRLADRFHASAQSSAPAPISSVIEACHYYLDV